jgi:predicted HicB family RNase H-like nuclease
MKHKFEYQGYYGSAEVSVEDNLLHGHLLFIKDVVSYAAKTPADLEQAFKEAVEDYLATCAELGDALDRVSALVGVRQAFIVTKCKPESPNS